MAESTPMIDAQHLGKNYGATRAVDDLSFQVSSGEVVGFLGPNGAGKSTTMRMITGFVKPTAGKVLVGGTDVAQDSIACRRRIGYLPENAPMYDEMMVIDFLLFVGQLRGVEPEPLRARIREIGERCGVMDVLGKDIGQLSKGYRQRVGLAQAMLHDPDLLILDEPTSGLDPNQIVEIRALIKELGKEKTIILSTHILPEVQATCSRVIIINDGKLVADDTPEALTAREAGSVVSVTVKGHNGSAIGDKNIQALLAKVPGVGKVDVLGEDDGALMFRLLTKGTDDPREAIFRTAVDNELVLIDLHREALSLEDTFRRLTRGEGGSDA